MVAVKVINLVDEEINEIYGEINILRMCKHANIVKYFGVYLKRTKLWVRAEKRRGQHHKGRPKTDPTERALPWMRE